ncbi:Carotenoid cleavage dioxygenase 7, chloroplastic [Apostasia shenzhenica]|uniref:Carotenoid cleavage dioxygenase 7, chloroplastic n=1 Tax=Apostasia shenzhenica TaxID=1088818 RepID=A0A2I0B8N7_9ASPA|nr:Carotenoid cleavage dioxygenase 7, chloroplastic [Apostasia shenzhenica]
MVSLQAVQSRSAASMPSPLVPAVKLLPPATISVPSPSPRSISAADASPVAAAAPAPPPLESPAANSLKPLSAADSAATAFWDYQMLFLSQRGESPEPIQLAHSEGAVPVDFPCGTYYLTGPGIFSDDYGSNIHPLDGHGYLRSFDFSGGGGEVRYAARYVETAAVREERDPEGTREWRFTHRGPFSVLRGGKRMGNVKVMKNVANTAVLRWAGRLLCLWEGGDPYEIDPTTLETIGAIDLVGDGEDGCRSWRGWPPAGGVAGVADVGMNIAAGLLRPILHEFDSNLELKQKKKFTISDHLMIHDWAFTDNHYILIANRIKLDLPGSLLAVSGLSPMISALAVNPSQSKTPVYLLPRFAGRAKQRRDWRAPIEVPSQLWISHVANAFEEDDGAGGVEFQIQASACSYEWFNFQKMFGYNWQSRRLDPSVMNVEEGKEELLPHLVRISIELDAKGRCGSCSVGNSSSKWSWPADFPAINQAFSGQKSSFLYAGTASGKRSFLPHFPYDTVVKMNCSDGAVASWWAGGRKFIGEPVFVPKVAGKEEDDGYLLVYDVAKLRCNLVILDAKKIGRANAAVVRLEVPKHLNFPLGFHGFWDDSDRLHREPDTILVHQSTFA